MHTSIFSEEIVNMPGFPFRFSVITSCPTRILPISLGKLRTNLNLALTLGLRTNLNEVLVAVWHIQKDTSEEFENNTENLRLLSIARASPTSQQAQVLRSNVAMAGKRLFPNMHAVQNIRYLSMTSSVVVICGGAPKIYTVLRYKAQSLGSTPPLLQILGITTS